MWQKQTSKRNNTSQVTEDIRDHYLHNLHTHQKEKLKLLSLRKMKYQHLTSY